MLGYFKCFLFVIFYSLVFMKKLSRFQYILCLVSIPVLWTLPWSKNVCGQNALLHPWSFAAQAYIEKRWISQWYDRYFIFPKFSIWSRSCPLIEAAPRTWKFWYKLWLLFEEIWYLCFSAVGKSSLRFFYYQIKKVYEITYFITHLYFQH